MRRDPHIRCLRSLAFCVSLVSLAGIRAEAQVLTISPSRVTVTYPSAAAERASRAERSPAASISFRTENSGSVSGEIAPDPRRVDAYYPLLTRVGQGWLVYAPALAGSDQHLVVSLPPDWQGTPRRSESTGFLYFGPITQESWIVDPGVPPSTSLAIADTALTAAAYFDNLVGATPMVDPIWIIGLLPDGDDQDFVADVAANGVVNVQVRRDLGRERLKDLAFLIAHEVFHLRALALWKNDELTDWENEGAAEYAAIKYMHSIGESEHARGQLEKHLNDCLRNIPAGGLGSGMTQAVRYSCGSVYAYIADLFAIGEVGELFPSLIKMGGHFPLPREPSRSPFDQALLTLRTGNDVGVTSLITADGGELWRILSEDPTDEAFAIAAIAPAVFALCDAVEGVSHETNGDWVVHSVAGCGGAGPSPKITSIDGRHPQQSGRVLFDLVADRCRKSGLHIGFSGPDGEATLTYVCETTPEMPLPFYRLVVREEALEPGTRPPSAAPPQQHPPIGFD